MNLDFGISSVKVHIRSLFVVGMARMAILRWFLRRRDGRTLVMTIGDSSRGKLVIKAKKFASGMIQAIVVSKGGADNGRVWITDPFVPRSLDESALN